MDSLCYKKDAVMSARRNEYLSSGCRLSRFHNVTMSARERSVYRAAADRGRFERRNLLTPTVE